MVPDSAPALTLRERLEAERERLREWGSRVTDAVTAITMPETFLDACRAYRAAEVADRFLCRVYADPAATQPAASSSSRSGASKRDNDVDDDGESESESKHEAWVRHQFFKRRNDESRRRRELAARQPASAAISPTGAFDADAHKDLLAAVDAEIEPNDEDLDDELTYDMGRDLCSNVDGAAAGDEKSCDTPAPDPLSVDGLIFDADAFDARSLVVRASAVPGRLCRIYSDNIEMTYTPESLAVADRTIAPFTDYFGIAVEPTPEELLAEDDGIAKAYWWEMFERRIDANRRSYDAVGRHDVNPWPSGMMLWFHIDWAIRHNIHAQCQNPPGPFVAVPVIPAWLRQDDPEALPRPQERPQPPPKPPDLRQL